MDYRILRYHNITTDSKQEGISKELFKLQMDFIARSNWHVLPLHELAHRIRKGYDTRGCLAVTFDDGLEKHLRVAAKILTHHGLPATFFVTLRQGSVEGEDRKFLLPEQIRRLSDEGFEIGNHTYTHNCLPRCIKRDAYKEIKYGKEELQRIINQEVTSFCFPGEAYNERLLRIVKATGHSCAIVSQNIGKPKDVFHLIRSSVDSMDELQQLFSQRDLVALKKSRRRRLLKDLGRMLFKDRWMTYL